MLDTREGYIHTPEKWQQREAFVGGIEVPLHVLHEILAGTLEEIGIHRFVLDYVE
jgi:hypothetical protein